MLIEEGNSVSPSLLGENKDEMPSLLGVTAAPVYTSESKSRAMYATAVESVVDEPTDEQGVLAKYDVNLEGLSGDNRDAASSIIVEKFNASMASSLSQLLEEDPSEENTQDVVDAYRQTSVMASEDPILDTFIKAVSLTDNNVEKNTFVQEYASIVARQAMEEQGGFESVLRTLQMFVPLSHTLDTLDITGIEIFDNTKSMIRGFQQMSPEDKIKKLRPLYLGLLENADGNEGRAVEEMMRLVYGDDSRGLELFLDGADVLLTFTPLALLAKSRGMAKVANEVGNAKKAGEYNNAALSSPAMAEIMGVDPLVAAANTSPFKFEPLLAEATDGIAHTTVDAVSAARRDIQTTLGELHDVPLRSIYRPDVEDSIQSSWLKAENDDLAKLSSKEGSTIEAEILDSNDYGFTVKTFISNGDDVEPITKVVKYTKNDAGGLDVVESGDVAGYVGSPEVWMNKIFRGSVDEATLIGLTEGHALNILQRAAKQAIPKNAESVKKLDDILLAGDDTGVVYTINELKNGIPTHNGIRVLNTDDEIAAYYAQRDLFDTLHQIKNKQIVDRKVFEGGVGVKINERKGTTTIGGKTTEHWGTSKIVYNADSKKAMDVATANKLFKEGGYKKVFLDAPIEFGGDIGRVTAAIVPEGRIVGYPKQALQYSKGYVPRNWVNVYYAARKEVAVLHNGEKLKEYQTTRFFDNKKEADAYVAKWKEENPDGNMAAVFRDERPSAEVEKDVINGFGGLYGTSRSNRKVLMGMNGDEPVRVSALRALDANINHISNSMPLNNFRMGMQATWEKSASKWLENPRDPMNSNFLPATPAKTEVALRKSREWMRDQMRIPAESERRWGNIMRSLGEWMEGKPLIGDKASKWALDMGARDPFAALRAGAFHAMLGWFNPAQLLVQAQSASVALSLHPTLAPKILPQVFRLRAGINTHMNEEALRKIAKASGMDGDEYVKLVQDYNKAGLQQSLKSSADYNAASLGYALDAGVISRSADKGLVFFREGESFGRMYSWLVSRDKWLKSGKSIKTQKDIDAITSDSIRMTLNLHRANRAHWQKGALSIPTQFWQINAKFIEALLPTALGSGKFTGFEKSKILLGQAMLYGGAGVPLAGFLNNGLDALMGEDHQMSAEELEMRRNGLAGLFQEMIFGDVLQGSGRLALGGGIKDIAIGIADMGNGDMPEINKAFGAFGGAGSRVFNAIGELGPYLNPNTNLDMTLNELETAITAVTDVVSSFNNFHTASIWYRTKSMTDKNGNTLYDLHGDEGSLIIGKALGLQPDKINEIFELHNYQRERKQMVSATTEAVLGEYNKLFSNFEIRSDANQKNFSNRIAVLLSPLSPVDQKKVMEAVAGRWAVKGSSEEENLINALESVMETGVTEFKSGHQTLKLNKTYVESTQ